MAKESGLTRRGLFRGLGTAAVIAGCKPGEDGEVPEDPQSAGAGPGLVGPAPTPLKFELNGEAVEVQAASRTTLAELLRLDLDRTGTKIVCDRGACGACTVMVDGAPMNSCMMLAHDVEGRKVTTVEGLGDPEQLSALQRAFVEHDALQCGFCTSGMLISSAALLRKGGTVTEERVKEAISGNLCRCGTYPHVVSAVMSVAKAGKAGEAGKAGQG